ncbi:TIR domain-containing anti-phage reverse transcriptase [Chromohalobacter salexigens]|uniref:TIR domain-containing anti-phage reverse transcriptase n=1 Tax=Chromohalobacter israelensis TaxID=141390 RepID=UPI0032E86334
MKLIDEDSNPLKKIKTEKDLCEAIGVNKGHLYYILYDIGVKNRYKHFNIPKKNGGVRSISSPKKGLGVALNGLRILLSENIEFKQSVNGFIEERGIIKNAIVHKRARWVLNLDIEDFFGSINFGRVRGVFLAKPFEMPEKVATLIARIATLENALPQGSHASPVISNIIASSLDNKLLKIAKKYRVKYTRYADDITFSGFSSINKELAYISDGQTVLGDAINSVFSKSGFSVNQSKLRLQYPATRQEVTGLVVNKKVNIPVEFKKKLRSAIHQWCINPEDAERHFLYNVLGKDDVKVSEGGVLLKRNIYGRLSYIAQAKGDDDPTYVNMAMKMGRHDPEPPKFLRSIMSKYHEYQVFICHASEDKEEIAHPLYDELTARGLSVFIDSKAIRWGDSLVDTINSALYKAKLVVAIVSESSVEKSWPQREINSVLAREINGESKLLVLVNGDADTLLGRFALLQDKLYRSWDNNAAGLAEEIVEIQAQVR